MKKILIIDDSPLIRKRIVELLMKSKDIRIAGEVGNGSDTIKWVERLKPDTVILDICLPDRNGISLLKTFKEHYPKIKVIMLTHLDDEIEDQAVESGEQREHHDMLPQGCEHVVRKHDDHEAGDREYPEYDGNLPCSGGLPAAPELRDLIPVIQDLALDFSLVVITWRETEQGLVHPAVVAPGPVAQSLAFGERLPLVIDHGMQIIGDVTLD